MYSIATRVAGRRIAGLAVRAAARRAVCTPVIMRSFSVATRLRNKAASEATLLQALESELRIEKQQESESSGQFADLKTFLESSGFEVKEAGEAKDEVHLYKKDGNEVINVYFSASDVIMGENLMEDEEEPMYDENEEEQIDIEGEDAPIRVNIVIERANGALGIEGLVQSDAFVWESIIPYESSQVALADSAEAEYVRRGIYQGPAFAHLDPELQAAFVEFLESRGINDELALFVANYASYKEQQLYMNSWLSKVADILKN
jgi:complement component 1 Q subcomponent-binding protein